MTRSDDEIRALIRESERNRRENPAVAADEQYRPHTWTAAEEAELVQRLHGSEGERIDRLVAEENERRRGSR